MTTYDANTGLEWLDVNLTAGQSYLSVRNGWHGYTSSEGFRFATRNETLQLFLDAGAVNIGTGFGSSAADAEAARSLLSLIGITLGQVNQDRSWMFYDPSTEPGLPTTAYVPSAVVGLWRLSGGDEGSFDVPGIYALQDYSSFEMASALVRVVPEPSSLFLLAPTLALVYYWRRR